MKINNNVKNLVIALLIKVWPIGYFRGRNGYNYIQDFSAFENHAINLSLNAEPTFIVAKEKIICTYYAACAVIFGFHCLLAEAGETIEDVIMNIARERRYVPSHLVRITDVIFRDDLNVNSESVRYEVFPIKPSDILLMDQRVLCRESEVIINGPDLTSGEWNDNLHFILKDYSIDINAKGLKKYPGRKYDIHIPIELKDKQKVNQHEVFYNSKTKTGFLYKAVMYLPL